MIDSFANGKRGDSLVQGYAGIGKTVLARQN